MKRGGFGKKGLSTILATLLILLLIFVAIGVLWAVVKNFVDQAAEQVTLGKFTLDMEIQGVNIVDNDSLEVKVRRNPGAGDIAGLSFIVSDGNSNEIIEYRNTTLAEHQERSFSIDMENFVSSEITNVQLAPIFRLSSGKEVTGDVKSSFDIATGTSTTPDGSGGNGSSGDGVVCGDDVINGTEVCEATNITSTCEDESYDGGTLGCNSNCLAFNVSSCTLDTCGDGVIDSGETCDDGDTTSGDGCSNVCQEESGYSCSGTPSVCTLDVVCGNALNQTGEQCDDGDVDNGDGCNSSCIIESGYTCTGGSGQSNCTADSGGNGSLGSELLTNGDIESGLPTLNGFSFVEDETDVTQTTAQSHGGSNSLNYTVLGSTQQTFDAPSYSDAGLTGTNYQLNFWLYVPSNQSWADNAFYVWSYGPTNEDQGWLTLEGWTGDFTYDTWVEYNINITMEGDESISFGFTTVTDSLDTVYIDDISFREIL